MKTTFKNILLTTMLVTAYSANAVAAETTSPAHTYVDEAVKGSHHVTVTINNIKSEDGYIMAALFNSEDTFLGDGVVRAERVAVDDDHVSFSYDNLPEGEYAITVFHDEDSDSELDTGMFGIPSEPYGFSNDAPVRFGPPKWKDAKFTVAANGATQTITLK